MAEFKDTGYDDAASQEGGDGNFAPKFGLFKAKIKEVCPPGQKGSEFEMKKSANGKPHYTARYVFEYADANGEVKTKSAFISCIGLWFPPLIKQLLAATSMDSPEGRGALMKNSDAAVGESVQIAIGARKKEFGKREVFEGFEVDEYNGKEYIANEIIGIYGPKEKVDFDVEAEEALRGRFKNAGGTGSGSNPPVDEAFDALVEPKKDF